MTRWEYLSFNITWSIAANDWATLSVYTGKDIVGMNDILNYYGAEAWEMVNIVDEFSITNDDGIREAKAYHVFFKRPLDD